MESKIEAVERLAASIIKTSENKYLEAMGQPPIIEEPTINTTSKKKSIIDKKQGTKSQKGDVLAEAKTLLEDDDHLDWALD